MEVHSAFHPDVMPESRVGQIEQSRIRGSRARLDRHLVHSRCSAQHAGRKMPHSAAERGKMVIMSHRLRAQNFGANVSAEGGS